VNGTHVCGTCLIIIFKRKEAFIKANYLPGDISEFDWGEVKLTIKGKNANASNGCFRIRLW
jgi:hypothetical protein